MSSAPQWLNDAVETFGTVCKAKLAGPGETEAAIRSPLEALLNTTGERLGVHAVFHDEAADTQRAVRPDYAVAVSQAITGYIEVKAPGISINPSTFRGHNKQQWDRLKDLPNLVYTNGVDWRLYRDQELVCNVSFTGGPLDSVGAGLEAPTDFETLITNFLRWKPLPITSVGRLVKSIAPLTRLLRGEVLDSLKKERAAISAGADEGDQPFHGLARDWRALLFPHADDKTFADGYAQTVTFALLLARSEGIELAGASLHDVGTKLGGEHALMGKALQLLTDTVASDFRVTLDLLKRVVAAVNWPRIRKGSKDTYLYLYEEFLGAYDEELRQASGSYYTPRPVVDSMVRLVEQLLASRLGKPAAFADPTVLTVDPAMGTGTFLHSILERAAAAAAERDGPGMVAPTVTDVASRLVGFEIQTGPFAVAEMRTTDLIREKKAKLPKGGLRLFVTDTLDDPHTELTQIASYLSVISQSRRGANKVKMDDVVTVVIGNPPYQELANGRGGWVEDGGLEHGKNTRPILEDFFRADISRVKAKLKNLYVFFYRWAFWKVWQSTPQSETGVVCFITPAGYLTGPAFTGMREFIRRQSTEGWIIDVTPEGQTPDIPTRIFPGVRQPLAIGIFVRSKNNDPGVPADIHYRSVQGQQAEKFAQLAAVDLDDDDWLPVRTDWTSPLTPATAVWDKYPSLVNILPWHSPGVFPTRTWVYGPHQDILGARWTELVTEPNLDRKAKLFRVSRDANLSFTRRQLPGSDTYKGTTISVEKETGVRTQVPIRVGYRSLDRQWVIPDSRLMDMPRRTLWAARIPGQVFVSELHLRPIQAGPGITFSALIPDFHFFKGSEGGRILPFLNPDGTPNVAPKFAATLSELLNITVNDADVLAYIAGVTSHRGYTKTFTDELKTPGIRVPFTASPDLFTKAVSFGRQVVWLHTYGEAFVDPADGRPAGDVRIRGNHARQPLVIASPSEMPQTLVFVPESQVLRLGDGEWGPVEPAAVDFTVGGKNVVNSWFNYRKRVPGGRRSSPLDDIHAEVWPTEWSVELVDLLTVLTRLTDLEPEQEDLLARVISNPVFTEDELAAAGVLWPDGDNSRTPRMPLDSGTDYYEGSQLTFSP